MDPPRGALTLKEMDPKTFRAFCDFIYEQSGITLKEGKESLVSARIAKRMRANGIVDPRAYLEFVMADRSGRELVEMIDAISTNLTFFFREEAHFDMLRGVLSGWRDQGQLTYRIWCAAASTGEEPYSIAMTVLDVLGEGATDTRILATDISTRVLKTCTEGVYGENRMRNVSAGYRQRFFERNKDRATGEVRYTVKPSLRELVFFKRLNLSTPPFPMRGPMDVVFCRNVMIYFDQRVRANLVNEIYRLLKPGGYLMVGHSESLAGIATPLERVCPATYIKPG